MKSYIWNMRRTLVVLCLAASLSGSAQTDTCQYTKTPWAVLEYCKPVQAGGFYYSDIWIEGNAIKRMEGRSVYVRCKYMTIQQCRVPLNPNCLMKTRKIAVLCP